MLLPVGHYASAQEVSPAVAVITGLSGSASHLAEDGSAAAALQVFQQLSAKETIGLNPGSSATFVFFTGRKETWEGPVTLRILPDGSEVVGSVEPGALREETEPEAGADFHQLPEVMGKSRAAVTVVLAPRPQGIPAHPDCSQWKPLQLTPKEAATLEQARAEYARRRAVSTPSDHTPEAMLLSVLVRYDQLDEVATIVRRLRVRYPGSAGLQFLYDYAERCGPYLQKAGL